MTNESEPAVDDDSSYEPDDDFEDSYASVVQVDRHEDIATICGRIDTAPSYAVVVHAPGGNRALSREIGMRRVLRHAEETGKALAFATTSVALSSRARAMGIPVARKPEHVRWDAGGRVIWRLAGRSFAVPAMGRLVQLGVIAGIAILVAGLVFTMAPSATVIAYPPSETLEDVVTISASELFEEIDLENMSVPATDVVSSRLVTVVIPTTGSALVGIAPAAVEVTATNGTEEEFTIPAGAVVIAELEDGNVEFEIDEDLLVAAGASGVVTATALAPGAGGNVPANSISRFADADFEEVTVTNAEAATGGEDEPRPAVDQEDIITLRDTANMLETADAIKETVIDDRPRDAIFIDTASVDVDRGEPSAVPGTLAEIVSMEVLVTVTATAIPESVLNEVARAVLAPDGGGGEFITGTVSAIETGARQVDVATGTITAEFRLRGEFARDTTAAEIEDAVKGLSPEDARSILQNDYGIDDAEVEVWPGWAPRIPRFGFRIDVEMRTPSEPEADQAATTMQSGRNHPAATPAPVPGS